MWEGYIIDTLQNMFFVAMIVFFMLTTLSPFEQQRIFLKNLKNGISIYHVSGNISTGSFSA